MTRTEETTAKNAFPKNHILQQNCKTHTHTLIFMNSTDIFVFVAIQTVTIAPARSGGGERGNEREGEGGRNRLVGNSTSDKCSNDNAMQPATTEKHENIYLL